MKQTGQRSEHATYALELELDVEETDLWLLVVLGLHLKPGVAERLLEGDASHQL